MTHETHGQHNTPEHKVGLASIGAELLAVLSQPRLAALQQVLEVVLVENW